MREAKTSGGIGHGALRHGNALGSWFLFIEHTSKVSEDYAGSIRRQTDSTTVVSHIYTYDRAQNILNFVQTLQNLIL